MRGASHDASLRNVRHLFDQPPEVADIFGLHKLVHDGRSPYNRLFLVEAVGGLLPDKEPGQGVQGPRPPVTASQVILCRTLNFVPPITLSNITGSGPCLRRWWPRD